MKIRLVDTVNDERKDVEFGTCELCTIVADHTFTTWIFEVDGEDVVIEGWYWVWGDLFEVTVDNTVDFAWWLHQREFKNINLRHDDYYDLDFLVDLYHEWCETLEEDREFYDLI